MFNFNDHLQELRAAIIALSLLLAATIIGFVWISIGVYHWLSSCLGETWGPIVLGMIYLLPLIIFAFMKAFGRQPAHSVALSNERADIAVLNLAKIFESLAGRSPAIVAIAAIVAGFLATRFPALLTVFMQILGVYAEDVKNRAAKAAENQSHDVDDMNV